MQAELSDFQGVTVIPQSEGNSDTDHGPSRIWGVSGAVCGARNVSMAIGRQAPHTEGTLHSHDCETCIFIVEGEVEILWRIPGGIIKYSFAHAGDFIFIPAGVEHAPINRSSRVMIYIVARSTPIQN